MRISPFLVDTFNHLQDSAPEGSTNAASHEDGAAEVYIEVILHGKTEGKFLEDARAACKEKMGDVSKLGELW